MNRRGKSSASEDSECRSKDSQEINCNSSLCVDADPCQRLKRHFSSLNSSSDTTDKRRKLLSSHNENSLIAIDFQDKNSFNEVLAAASFFLEKGECSRETACNFYSLIQSATEHVSNIKQQNNDNIKKVNEIKFGIKDFTQKALDICDKIKTKLTLSYIERVSDYLTEHQKEDIEKFQKLFDEFYKQLKEDCIMYKEKNVSDNSVSVSKPSKRASCIILKSKQREELLTEKNKLLAELAIMKEKQAKLQETSNKINVVSSRCQNQARLIAILSPFLYFHRLNGQSVAEISSYLKSLGHCIKEQEIENILMSFPSEFRECQLSAGHTDEKRWIFCGCDR